MGYISVAENKGLSRFV